MRVRLTRIRAHLFSQFGHVVIQASFLISAIVIHWPFKSEREKDFITSFIHRQGTWLIFLSIYSILLLKYPAYIRSTVHMPLCHDVLLKPLNHS